MTPTLTGWAAEDLFVVLDSAETVRTLQPDLTALGRLTGVRGIIVTARGDGEFDAVSRFFAPAVGVAEDPVTGSAHCAIGPYWAAQTGKPVVRCHQASARGGVLEIEPKGARVLLRGPAVTVLEGRLLV